MVDADLRARWPAAACTTSSPAGSRATASTRAWVVPHFEKMLYDNALLLRVYAAPGAGSPASPLALRVADETADFLLRDLRTAEGGFASALDADTDGVEGKTYVWTPAQLREVLGADDGAWAARLLDGHRRRARSSTAPRRCSCPPIPTTPRAGTGVRAALLAARDRAPAARPRRQGGHRVERAGDRRARRGRGRARPARAGWPPPRRAAELLLDRARGRRAAAPLLARRRRRRRGGRARGPRRAGRRPARAAPGHRRAALARRGDRPARRRRSRTSPTGERRLLRHRRRRRGPAAPAAETHRQRRRRAGAPRWPSALLTASVLTDDGGRYRDAAEAALRGAGTLLRRVPAVRGHWLTAAEALLAGPLQVAIAGRAGPRRCSPARGRRAAAGGTVIVAGRAGRAGVPLLAARPLVDGAPGGLRLPRLRLRPPRHRPCRRARRAVRPAVTRPRCTSLPL